MEIINICRHCRCLFALSFVLCLFAFSIPSEAAELYETVKIDRGQLHIITTDQKEILPPKRSYKLGDEILNQVGFMDAVISDDKTTVGWLALYPNCCTSYPIPLELIIFNNGKIMRVFIGTGLPIWKWKFENKGTQVAFEQETVHGSGGIHYELREIKTGLLIDSLDGDPHPKSPKWLRDFNQKRKKMANKGNTSDRQARR